MKKRITGMVLKDDLETLLNDPELEGDYEFLGRVARDFGGYKDLNADSDFSGLDAVFFFHYPFSRELAEKLSKYEDKIPFINKPSGVLKTSEKTFEYEELKDFAPATKLLEQGVSYEDISGFAENFDSVVVKPVDGTGGKGIYFVDKPYKEEDVLVLKNLGDEKSGRYIIQEYLHNNGDHRILCYNGIVLGGFGRRSDSTRIHNVSGGGKLTAFKPSKKEIEIAEEVSNRLKGYGVFFSGLDLINDKLVEANTAMPGGIDTMTPYRFKSLDDMYKAFVAETRNILGSYK